MHHVPKKFDLYFVTKIILFFFFFLTGFCYNIGSIPSVLADRIRIRRTFADSTLTPYINIPATNFLGNAHHRQQRQQHVSSDLSVSNRLKMIAENYLQHHQQQQQQQPIVTREQSLLSVTENLTEFPKKKKQKLSFSIESILA